MGNIFSKDNSKTHIPRNKTNISESIYDVEISNIFTNSTQERLDEYQSLIFTPIISNKSNKSNKSNEYLNNDNLDITEETPFIWI